MDFKVEVIKMPMGVAFKIGCSERRKATTEEMKELVDDLRTLCNDLERKDYNADNSLGETFLDALIKAVKEHENTPPPHYSRRSSTDDWKHN